jgi:peptidoglycan/LPS O-acetylase OafA/YrhL
VNQYLNSTQPSASSLLQTKQHFLTLDGLRGIAAISVVIFHFMEIAVPKYEESFIAHAYLAVDFFFCLSGFVIAYAYDEKLSKIGIGSFIKLRLIRLHPLVIIGAVIGIIAFIFDPFDPLYQKYSDKNLWMFIASCLMIPYPLVRERYFNLFHLNPPTWSLFWEYVANIVYALILVRINRKLLSVLVVMAAVALAFEAHRSGHLSVGWGGDNIIGGAARVAFSFMAGLLIYRSNFIINSKIGFIGCALMLLATFLIPYNEKTNPIVDVAVVVLYYPLLIALAAGVKATGAYKKLCHFLGELSYPLYMVHYPFIWLFMSYVLLYKPAIDEMTVIMAVGTPLLMALAYIVLKFIDEPLRKYLKGMMKKRD